MFVLVCMCCLKNSHTHGTKTLTNVHVEIVNLKKRQRCFVQGSHGFHNEKTLAPLENVLGVVLGGRGEWNPHVRIIRGVLKKNIPKGRMNSS
mmetsp:Transcript_54897/g.66121  ORF Transcript_54897/g.66121 Transcript_54897/m.66121 type:complete len:92 (-) Transcript_54897:408-683(-)